MNMLPPNPFLPLLVLYTKYCSIEFFSCRWTKVNILIHADLMVFSYIFNEKKSNFKIDVNVPSTSAWQHLLIAHVQSKELFSFTNFRL